MDGVSGSSGMCGWADGFCCILVKNFTSPNLRNLRELGRELGVENSLFLPEMMRSCVGGGTAWWRRG